MKYPVFLSAMLFAAVSVSAQDMLSTKKGRISFYSEAPLENIEARNNEVTGIIDTKKAEVAFYVLIKSFKFEKALMEEHFNTTYMESDKYPKSTFTGKIKNPETVKWDTDGSYRITVEGTLTIHNVSKPLSTEATVTVKDKNVSSNAKFNVRVADFDIKIPSAVSRNIAETVEVTVDCQYTAVQNK